MFDAFLPLLMGRKVFIVVRENFGVILILRENVLFMKEFVRVKFDVWLLLKICW